MSIHFQMNVDAETADEAIAEFRKVFGALTNNVIPTSAPVVVTDEAVEIIHPAPKSTRKKKDKEPETIEGTMNPLPDASSAEKTESDSTASSAEKSDTSASNAALVPDLDTVRAKLKSYKKFMTDNALATGADAKAADETSDELMFKFLGTFGAKNASTISEAKRAEVIKAVDAAMSVSGTEIATLEDTQAALKRLAATDNFGHEAVFKVLGKYGAKNGATVPEDKRAALIAEIDALLAGAK